MATEGPLGQSWRTPASVENTRWHWLEERFGVEGQAFDDVLTRLDRIEAKLDELLQRRRPGRAKVDAGPN